MSSPTAETARTTPERFRIGVSFAAITLLGIAAGAIGVLLPEQQATFDVDKATIGLQFFAFSVGYITTALLNGPLLHRLGVRRHLVLGTAAALIAGVGLAVPSAFGPFLALQALLGLGMGVLDAGFNTYLSTLRRSTALLNYFHAFFGIGALAGPILAAAIVARGFSWRVFYGLYAIAMVVQVLALLRFPAAVRTDDDTVARPRLGRAVRLPAVILLAGFLAVYVGIEASVGNWSFSYLTEERGQGLIAAGWSVSGYWFGLTVGRLTLNATAERIGWSVTTLTGFCIGGVGVAALGVWLLPATAASVVALVLIGFFLGPLFPTTIATVPRLVRPDLVATAIGVLIACSLAGGAAVPWLVGATAQRIGMWSLLVWSAASAAVLGLLWWRVTRRLAAHPTVRVEPPA